jgi:hypothetical protein
VIDTNLVNKTIDIDLIEDTKEDYDKADGKQLRIKEQACHFDKNMFSL